MHSSDLILPSYHALSVFRVSDGYLAIDPDSVYWVRVAEAELPAINMLDGKSTVGDLQARISGSFPPALQKPAREFLAKMADTYPRETSCIPRPDALALLYLLVTDRCNSACKYCFRDTPGDSLMPVDLAIKALTEFARMARPQSKVVFTGGEPLLHPDLVELMGVAKSLGLETALQTNSILLNEDLAGRLAPVLDRTLLSIDSTLPHVNDALRGYPGHLESVRNAIALLADHGTSTTLCATITSLNTDDISRIPQAYPDLSFRFTPLLPIGRGCQADDVALPIEEFVCRLERLAEAEPSTNPPVPLPGFGAKSLMCDAGTGTLSVASNGDVFPCQMLHHPDWVCGSLVSESLDRVYAQSPVLRKLRDLTVEQIDSCSDCVLRFLCGGGCRANALWISGSAQAKDPCCNLIQSQLVTSMLASYCSSAAPGAHEQAGTDLQSTCHGDTI